MGSLTLPSSGPVYADAQIFIYSVEKHPIYAPTLRPLWEAVARGDLEVLGIELTLMETLIGPLKQGDATLETDYENFFASPGIRMLPITSSILRAGAHLRATLNSIRTPDAIHAATGHSCSCSLFLTKDPIFRRIPGSAGCSSRRCAEVMTSSIARNPNRERKSRHFSRLAPVALLRRA